MSLSALLILAGCHGAGDSEHGVPGDRKDRKPWQGIVIGERIRAIGNEPFWNAEIRNSLITYRTPDTPGGEHGPATGFAGRGGASFSGELAGKDYTLAISPGPCRDGMSDRRYPFNALFKIGEEIRKGCAWTDEHPAEAGHPGDATKSPAESGIAEP